MDVVLSILAFLLAATGIAGCIIPILPGVILSYGGLLCAYFCSYSSLSTATIVIWAAVVAAAWAADYFLPGFLAKRFGGTRAGSVGATIGMIAGMFFGFAGLLLGPFVGAVAGEMLHDRRDSARAFRVGIGAFLSFIVGTGIKLAAALGIAVYIWRDTFPVLREWIANIF